MKVIVRLDLRKPLLDQFEVMDDDLYGRLLEAMSKAGWWNDDTLDEAEQEATETVADWWLLTVELHQQAHPGEPPDPAACRSEPCRSLPLTMIAGQQPPLPPLADPSYSDRPAS
jgi:hypothetical protein